MATLTRRDKLEVLRRLEEQEPQLKADEWSWEDIYVRIRNGSVLPILGGAVRLKRIFGLEHTDAGVDDASRSNEIEGLGETNGQAYDASQEPESNVLMDLSDLWAKQLKYPLKESRNLARVAQYNRVKSTDLDQAKRRFLDFLKKSILDLALALDSSVKDQVPQLAQEYRSNNLSFADIVTQLDYPRYIGREDPLRILARFQLPIYVTTSYFDFIERALKAEGISKVRTQFCLWNMDPGMVAPEHRPDPTYAPTPEEPLVYHLFGLERYPQSLVLSEDDYLDFVLAIAKDYDTEEHLLPLELRSRFEECSLLLMGYRLADWEFRVLFRGLINLLHGALKDMEKTYSIAIQLDPHFQEQVLDEDCARDYLEQYFKKARFQVVWMSTETFIGRLWDYYDRRRRGVL